MEDKSKRQVNFLPTLHTFPSRRSGVRRHVLWCLWRLWHLGSGPFGAVVPFVVDAFGNPLHVGARESILVEMLELLSTGPFDQVASLVRRGRFFCFGQGWLGRGVGSG